MKNDIAARVQTHAEKIICAAGSNLLRYDTRFKVEIMAAVMDCYKEAFCAGADFALAKATGPDRRK